MTQSLDSIQFHSEQTLKDVMKAFLSSYVQSYGFGLIIDNQRKCVGVITEGDIRRAIVSDRSTETPLQELMNRNFVYVTTDASPHQMLRLFDNDPPIAHLPVLDKKGRLVNLLSSNEFRAFRGIKKKLIRSRSPVRISFGGGGTDMSMYFNKNPSCALNITINKYCYTTVDIRADNRIKLTSEDFNEEVEVAGIDQLQYDGCLDLVKACIKLMQPSFGFNLETSSDVEPGTGLGGSAALAVSVIGALNYFRNEKQLDKYAMADVAYQAERIELNIKGGWQDQYAAVFGGLNFLEFREDEIFVNPLRLPEDILLELHFNLLMFRVGGTRESGMIISDQQEAYGFENNKIQNQYTQQLRVARKMKDMLVKGNLGEFGELLNEAWSIKKTFADCISNDHIDEIYEAAIKAGASGGKLLGAGHSGYLLLFCDPKFQSNVVSRLKSLGARNETFDFVETGVQSWAQSRSNTDRDEQLDSAVSD